MGRPSKVDRLPDAVREAIADLRRQGRTIDEILAHIRDMGVASDDVSRSGLGEHIKEIDALAKEAQKDRAIAEAVVARFGEEAEDKVFRGSVEMLQGLIFRMTVAMRQGDVMDLSAGDMMFLSRAMNSLAAASKIDTDRAAKIEARAIEKAKREAVAEVEKAAGECGMSQETVDVINRRIAGIAVR
ncbi:hypothetical protein HDIA_2263 [Hartmannibacter diazotrophicus]|uniref:Uncharacterized protein n=1 Tax=Hartmannibacter diazotrophicus TaxID=1482074 RepID=A0A2C9D658_9HYPH|nr:phage protein Gp27 family protein [Hartmannibacter diazotrophicus]SON55804.1 hypothetical protein HDIA_2263 [Hartmannibacter diazotrophicus]